MFIAAIDGRLEIEKSALVLEKALADVTEARDARTRFLAAASHDLGQPLQAGALFFDQVITAPTPRQREQAIRGVKSAFGSAGQILSHMLNHFSLQADAVTPQLGVVPIGRVLRKIAGQYGPAAKQANKRIKVVYSGMRIKTDPALLERLLGIFVSNAISHSTGPRILIGVRRLGAGGMSIWVLDDCEGIAQVDETHIFDEYYRGVASHALIKGGFGLGLASAVRIAALLGGRAGQRRVGTLGGAFFVAFDGSAL